MSGAIPDDIREKAKAVFDDVRGSAYYDDKSDYPGIDWDADEAIADIARAILAERERWEAQRFMPECLGQFKGDGKFCEECNMPDSFHFPRSPK